MNKLDELENKSIYTIREAYSHYPNIALLWSIGKDSTCLLWLCLKAFLGKLPFPALHIDTSYKFPEMYKMRDDIARQFGLKLIVAKNEKALAEGMAPWKEGRLACCGALKTEALKDAIRAQKFEALIVGIRRDEHGVRAKERVFSPRNANFQWNYTDQPMEIWEQYEKNVWEKEADGAGGQHYRIHPLLDWTEVDIWEYTQREEIPVNELYFAKDGQRFRSLGCTHCTLPLESASDTVEKVLMELKTSKVAERSGRCQDKESAFMMQKLRSLGYM